MISFVFLLSLLFCTCWVAVLGDVKEAKVAAVENALKMAVQLDFSLYNKNEEFYISILTEDGYKICDGRLSKAMLEKIECAYDKAMLRRGDNIFFITVFSTKKKEIVMQTTSHFYYDGPVQSPLVSQIANAMKNPMVVGSLAAGGSLWLYQRANTRSKPRGLFGYKSDSRSPSVMLFGKPNQHSFSFSNMKKSHIGLASAAAVASGGLLLYTRNHDLHQVQKRPVKRRISFSLPVLAKASATPRAHPAAKSSNTKPQSASLPSCKDQSIAKELAEQLRSGITVKRAMTSTLVLVAQAVLVVAQRLIQRQLGAELPPLQLNDLFLPLPLHSHGVPSATL